MPFTPAHTAIVLPLLRVRVLSATGLVVGSVSPDFEYFIKFSVDGTHGHTWPGLLYFDLPVTFLVAVIFHQFVRRNLVLNLPGFLRDRLGEILSFDFLQHLRKNFPGFVASALIGGASHIIWDGFTHGNGFFVHYFSFYEGAFVPFQGVKYPLWYALQHISTFVGLAVVAAYVGLMPKRETPARASLLYWVLIFSIAGLAVIIRFLIFSKDMNLGNVVVSCISGTCIALLVCGLIPQRIFIRGPGG